MKQVPSKYQQFPIALELYPIRQGTLATSIDRQVSLDSWARSMGLVYQEHYACFNTLNKVGVIESVAWAFNCRTTALLFKLRFSNYMDYATIDIAA